jgi:hypothetical protein
MLSQQQATAKIRIFSPCLVSHHIQRTTNNTNNNGIVCLLVNYFETLKLPFNFEKMSGSSFIEFDMGGAMNALSASPDWTHIVVAGRDVFKIVKVCELFSD